MNEDIMKVILFNFLRDTIEEFSPEKLQNISMKKSRDFVEKWMKEWKLKEEE